MRLQTNVEFLVSGGSPISIPKAFKAIRRIAPQLTLGEFQQKLSNGSVVASAVTYRNEISEYLENLNVLVDALKEFGKHVSRLVLTDPAKRAISVDDLEETLVFHIVWERECISCMDVLEICCCGFTFIFIVRPA